MGSNRYCKCHFYEGESEHWGLLDRKAFAHKGAQPHYAPDTVLSPCHLLLELSFDWEEERVWGSTTYELEVKGPGVTEIAFDAMNLDISRVLLGRKQVDFENTGTRLILHAPKPLAVGSKVKVKVFHSVTRPVAGIYFTKPDPHYPYRFQTVWTQGQDEDSRYYFPCLDRPNFKQSSEVILKLPPGMFGLSNGKLLRKKETRSQSLFHYKLEIPYSTYLLTIVAGEFSEYKKRSHGVDIKWYVQKGREKQGINSFKDTADMIRFFSEYTGYSYPYSHYTQIAVPEFIFGGMENFTATTQTDLTLLDDRATLDMDSNGLVAHEAAHTWFGNVVTAKDWSHAWLHESFATYFDALYTRESKGQDEFRYQLLEDAETYFSEDRQYRRPIVTRIYKEPIDLFDAHLYPGGAVRLHHLVQIVGEKLFRQALAIYLKRHEFGSVETVDLVRCLEEVSGRNHDRWVEEWIYRGGYPTLDLGASWEAASRIQTVTIKQTQKSDKKNEDLLFHLPLKIRFYYARGQEDFPVEIGSKEEKFCFKLKSKPLFFRLDPDYECPCKKIRLDIPRNMLHQQLKRDPDPIGRIEAAAALVKKPSTSDVQILGERLRKESFWGVAVRIAQALGKIGGAEARNYLIRGLKISHHKTRRGVVQALGDFVGDKTAAKAIKKIAEGDASYRVEAAAFASLGRIKDSASRSFLEASLDRPSHNYMAQIAIYNALARLEDEESWDVLVEGAEYGARSNSRGAAMRGLSLLGRRFEHRKMEAVEHFRRFAQETRGTTAAVFRGKLGAIQSMSAMADISAVPILIQLADKESDGRLRRRAEETVTHLFESAKKPQEIKAIRSELDDVSRENKSLRERLDSIEKNQEAASKNKDKKGK